MTVIFTSKQYKIKYQAPISFNNDNKYHITFDIMI